MRKWLLLTLMALAHVGAASALDLQSTTAPGRAVPSLSSGEIAINRADRTLFFKNVDGTIGRGSLMNATPAGRQAVEQSQADGLTVGGAALPSLLNAKAPSASPVLTGVVSMAGVSLADLTLTGTPNPNAIRYAPGNAVSFCPLLSCINGPPNGTVNSAYFDHQRASLLISAVTQVDGAAEEQTLATITTVNTGRQKPRTPSTAYALGDNSTNGNATYRVTTAGTTSSSSTNPLPTTRPTSLPFTVTDGSVVWTWINDGRINGKLGHYNEVAALSNAGTVWAGVDNLELRPGYLPSGHFSTAREVDLTNNSGTDCVISVSNCYGLSVFLQGSNYSTAFMDLSSANGTPGQPSNYAALYGILLGGAKSVRDHDISIQSSGAVGIDIGSFGGATHSFASVRDRSTAPTSYDCGNTGSACFTTNNASSPYALVTAPGQKTCINLLDNCLLYGGTGGGGWQFQRGGSTVATIGDGGNITATGTLSGGNVSTGGSVAANGSLSGASLSVGGLLYNLGTWTSYTPTVTTDSGTLPGASATGAYAVAGKTVFYRVRVMTGGTVSGSGSLNFSLPAGLSSKGGATVLANENATTYAFYGAKVSPTDNKGKIYNLTSLAYPVDRANMVFDVSGTFEAP